MREKPRTDTQLSRVAQTAARSVKNTLENTTHVSDQPMNLDIVCDIVDLMESPLTAGGHEKAAQSFTHEELSTADKASAGQGKNSRKIIEGIIGKWRNHPKQQLVKRSIIMWGIPERTVTQTKGPFSLIK
jgi:hypothetical protein